MSTARLPTAGPLGAALRCQVVLDCELVSYCETGHRDALERARNGAAQVLANIERELLAPSIPYRRSR